MGKILNGETRYLKQLKKKPTKDMVTPYLFFYSHGSKQYVAQQGKRQDNWQRERRGDAPFW